MHSYKDVAVIITAMTDEEQPFLSETVRAVLSDPCIDQVVLCVEEKNDWLDTTVSSFLTDPRLQIVRLPLLPPGAVRNKALNHIQKPWVAYCDGDDIWCEGKTLIQRTVINDVGCDFVGADHYLIDEEGKICAFALARYLPMPSSWIVRTEIMRQYPFNEALSQGSDGEWWIRTNNFIKKARCPRMLLHYRVRSGSVSSNTPSKQRKAKIVALSKIPGLKFIILFFTYCMWLFTKKRQYIWLPEWS